MEKLTEEERELIAKNHNLIDFFARINKLDLEEYYGILAEGLCKAAKGYVKVKSDFKTYAFRVLKNSVAKEIRRQNAGIRIPNYETYSIYAKPKYEEGIQYVDIIVSPKEILVDEAVIRKIIIEENWQRLTEREIKIIELLTAGYTRQEVADELSKRNNPVTERTVANCIKKIRRKLRECVE